VIRDASHFGHGQRHVEVVQVEVLEVGVLTGLCTPTFHQARASFDREQQTANIMADHSRNRQPVAESDVVVFPVGHPFAAASIHAEYNQTDGTARG